MTKLSDSETEPRRGRRFGRPTYANVTSTLALMFALTGGAVYASHELINGSDVVNESLTGADIRGRAATSSSSFVDGSLTGYDIANGSIRSDDIGTSAVDSARVLDSSLTGSDLRNGTITASDLAPAEAWRQVLPAPADPSQDPSGRFACYGWSSSTGCLDSWRNWGDGWNTAAYRKDPFGTVHLKGLVRLTLGSRDMRRILDLPAGYRPEAKELQAVIQRDGVGRVDVLPSGAVSVNATTGEDWLSLDGITFRAAR